MNIIGIDASLTNTAVCIFDGQKHTMRCCGSKPAGDGVVKRIDRFLNLRTDITKAVEDTLAGDELEAAFIEGYAFGARCNREVLGEFGGLLREWLCKRAVRVYEVPPTSLKLWATGSGKGDKTPVIAALVKRYGHVFDTNDEYDAYALARFGWQFVGQEKPANETQRQAIEKVLNGKQKTKPK